MNLALAYSDACLLVVFLQFFVLLPLEHWEFAATSQRETCVGDGQAALQELGFIGCFDREVGIGIARAVDVVVRSLARQREVAYNHVSIAVEVL